MSNTPRCRSPANHGLDASTQRQPRHCTARPWGMRPRANVPTVGVKMDEHTPPAPDQTQEMEAPKLDTKWKKMFAIGIVSTAVIGTAAFYYFVMRKPATSKDDATGLGGGSSGGGGGGSGGGGAGGGSGGSDLPGIGEKEKGVPPAPKFTPTGATATGPVGGLGVGGMGGAGPGATPPIPGGGGLGGGTGGTGTGSGGSGSSSGFGLGGASFHAPKSEGWFD